MATKIDSPVEPRKTKDYSDKDWEKMRLEYVTTSITMTALARKYGVPKASVSKHSSRGEWEAERKEHIANLDNQVKSEAISKTVDELKAWNEDTLQEAKYLREGARRMYMRPMANGTWRFNARTSAAGIQAAAAANVAADKLARLALGASTENNSNTNRELPASVDDFV